MQVLLAHPTTNQFFRHLATSLYEHKLLGVPATCFNWRAEKWQRFSMYLPSGLRRELMRRSFSEKWAGRMISRPGLEVARLLSVRMGWHSWLAHQRGWCCLDAVYQDFDRWLAKQLTERKDDLDAVYAYEDSSFAVFKRAKELGKHRVYDLPIAYWQTLRTLLGEEKERLPEWKVTLGGGVEDSEAKLERKTQEMELAEVVVCPSHFVVNSLPEEVRLHKKIVMAPFGSPQTTPNEAQTNHLRSSRMRVLFAGSMSQRKGLGDLMAAMKLLNRSDVELVVMGSLQAPMDFYSSQYEGFTYEPGRPHHMVLELMRSCDVFCLPSIVEGRALVMQEAMSQGLPLIITSNTGGEDLIEEGVTGSLVPIRSPEQIAEKIAWFADHRDMLPDMAEAAKAKAAGFTWYHYGKTIAEAISKLKS